MVGRKWRPQGHTGTKVIYDLSGHRSGTMTKIFHPLLRMQKHLSQFGLFHHATSTRMVNQSLPSKTTIPSMPGVAVLQ